ncbi:MAG: hypothetical protein H8E05_00925 [Bacteroidetes bacterium]|nr:hypothetical protein [Bacteroidota bacterium]
MPTIGVDISMSNYDFTNTGNLADAFSCLIEGFEKIGCDIFFISPDIIKGAYYPDSYPSCDLVLSIGIPCDRFKVKGAPDSNWKTYMTKDAIFKTQAARGGSVLILENGYLNRGVSPEYKNSNDLTIPSEAYWGLGLNGLNGRGIYTYKDMPPDRWNKLDIELEDWKINSGKKVVFCGQRNLDSSIQHISRVAGSSNTDIELSIYKSLQRLIYESSLNFDSEVILRPHPLTPEYIFSNENINLSKKGTLSLQEELKDCGLLCTINSNSSVESVISGVPTLVLDRGSMAWEVSNTSLNFIIDSKPPMTPDREQWAHNLAYAQWTENELRSGEAAEHLLKVLKKSNASLDYLNGTAKNKTLPAWKNMV